MRQTLAQEMIGTDRRAVRFGAQYEYVLRN